MTNGAVNKDDLSKFCRDPLAAVERQVRTSHALGKFIVESAIGRVLRRRDNADPSPGSQPGPATAPHVKADRTDVNLPIPEADFAILTSADVVDLINRSDDDEVRAIGEYELAHRRRRLVVEAVRARVPS